MRRGGGEEVPSLLRAGSRQGLAKCRRSFFLGIGDEGEGWGERPKKRMWQPVLLHNSNNLLKSYRLWFCGVG